MYGTCCMTVMVRKLFEARTNFYEEQPFYCVKMHSPTKGEHVWNVLLNEASCGQYCKMILLYYHVTSVSDNTPSPLLTSFMWPDK